MSPFSIFKSIKGEREISKNNPGALSNERRTKEVEVLNQDRLHRAVQLYGDTVFKIAMAILRNPHDADDAHQETFLRYFKHAPEFTSDEHEKSWLIRCATNVSKSMLWSIFRHSHEPLKENLIASTKDDATDLLFRMPLKERIILQLHYVEGYTAEEIGKMLHLSKIAVRKRMERARKKAKIIYEKERV